MCRVTLTDAALSLLMDAQRYTTEDTARHPVLVLSADEHERVNLCASCAWLDIDDFTAEVVMREVLRLEYPDESLFRKP
jgi:hypothetical protein